MWALEVLLYTVTLEIYFLVVVLTPDGALPPTPHNDTD